MDHPFHPYWFKPFWRNDGVEAKWSCGLWLGVLVKDWLWWGFVTFFPHKRQKMHSRYKRQHIPIVHKWATKHQLSAACCEREAWELTAWGFTSSYTTTRRRGASREDPVWADQRRWQQAEKALAEWQMRGVKEQQQWGGVEQSSRMRTSVNE